MLPHSRPSRLRAVAALLAATLATAPSLPAQSTPPQYVAIDIETLLGRDNVTIIDLNDYGHLVGDRLIDRTFNQPLLWIQGRTHELALPPNQSSGQPVAINNDGVIVGTVSAPSGSRLGLRWTSGLPETLVELYGINGIPANVNEAGDIVGSVTETNGTRTFGFSILDDTVTQIFPTRESTRIADINAARIMVGGTQENSSSAGRPLRREGTSNLVFGFNGSTGGSANAINAAGQIAGEGRATGFTGRHAFRYELVNGSGQIEDLHPPGANESSGQVIAADGTVFGWASFAGESSDTAMILDGADSVPLGDLTLGADHAQLARVMARNANGWLVAQGPRDISGDIPVPAHHLLIPRTPATSTFTNLSVRSELASSTPLIVGTATTGGARPILARGIGPGLEPYLPAGTPLAGDPALTVFDAGSTETAANDDWTNEGETAEAIATAQAFPLTPGSADAAVVASADGLASVHLTNSGTAGVGLVELFNLDNSDPAQRLINLSARYEVGTGENLLIAGFIISGTGPKTVLIRGVGPGLVPHGVTGVLADPEIVLHNALGEPIATNDDWNADLASVFDAAGAFSLTAGSTDAAMVVPLWPGLYTVHLRGADGGTGQGLIEIYDLDL